MLIELEIPSRKELMRKGVVLYNGWGQGPSRHLALRVYAWCGRHWNLREKPGTKPEPVFFECETQHDS